MAQCNVCHGEFKPAVVRTSIDDIAWVAEASCPHCHAQYSDNVAHLESDGERRAMPVAGDGYLELMDDSIPVGVRVKNDFKRLINEARARGFKRGYAFHRLKEKYDLETLQEHLPRHRGDWWRQAA